MAEYPEDLYYTPDHEWVKMGNDNVARVGITAYATQTLGDIVFVSLPEVGSVIAAKDSVAEVESTKSVSEVFCPVAGTITRVNEEVGDNPEAINADPYGQGWLFEVTVDDMAQLDDLLDAASYAGQLS